MTHLHPFRARLQQPQPCDATQLYQEVFKPDADADTAYSLRHHNQVDTLPYQVRRAQLPHIVGLSKTSRRRGCDFSTTLDQKLRNLDMICPSNPVEKSSA